MDMLTDKQSADLINQFKAELARRGLSHAERLQRFSGFLTCMCHFAAIDGYQMRDIFTEYEKHLSTQVTLIQPESPLSESTLELINRFKIYLANTQYQRDKCTMMDGYLMALQHQRLIDQWQAYAVIQQYEKELANV